VQINFVVFEKNAKIHSSVPKNDVIEPKLGYSNNQLNCKQVTSQF